MTEVIRENLFGVATFMLIPGYTIGILLSNPGRKRSRGHYEQVKPVRNGRDESSEVVIRGKRPDKRTKSPDPKASLADAPLTN